LASARQKVFCNLFVIWCSDKEQTSKLNSFASRLRILCQSRVIDSWKLTPRNRDTEKI